MKCKGLSPKTSSLKDCLQAELDYLSLECDSRHLALMFCSLLNQGEDLPRGSASACRRVLKRYKDETVLRVIEERDRLIERERARTEVKLT